MFYRSLFVSGGEFIGLPDGHGNKGDYNIVTTGGTEHMALLPTLANWTTGKATQLDIGSAAQTKASKTFAWQQKTNSDDFLKGRNEAIDIRAYGARSVSPAPSTTANARAASKYVALANGSQFKNGDTIRIDAAGPATTLTTTGTE